MKRNIIIIAAVLLFITTPLWAATRTVTNCADSGAGSLRQALSDAGSGDEIVFDITTLEAGYSTGEFGPGLVTNEAGTNTWFRIISNNYFYINNIDNLYINGSSQTREATNEAGPEIEIRCDSSGDHYGIWFANSDNGTIEGLVINGHNVNGRMAIFLSDSNGNNIKGCYVGVTASGEAAYANNQGIYIQTSNNNIIGGTTAAERNIISGNTGNGFTATSSSNSNEVIGNYIGVGPDGETALANGIYGISIVSSFNNRIGTSESGGGNLILADTSGTDSGIYLGNSTTTNNKICNNIIGLTSSEAIPSSRGKVGILLTGGANYNFIGGTGDNEGNVISGNTDYGIYISSSGTNSNEVLGNYIGTDSTGTIDKGNTTCGICFASGPHYNRIGNATEGGRNIISGNDSHGVLIDGSGTRYNELLGNYIGTTSTGATGLPNLNGISFTGGAEFNKIGDGTTGGRNIIASGTDSGNGIVISGSGTNSNEVLGNYIGTNANGNAELGFTYGINIQDQAKYNTIGDGTTGGRNVISGNKNNGIRILGAGSDYNEIYGNFIGVQGNGTTALQNDNGGILIYNGPMYTRVGSSESSKRNILSGSTNGAGIRLANVTNNYIEGNWLGMGTDESAVANEDGINLNGSAEANQILSNVISGNTRYGIAIGDTGQLNNSNEVYSNFIGVKSDGTTALPNGYSGIYIEDGHYNIIGSTEASKRNIISGQSGAGDEGIDITAASTNNYIQGNWIGVGTDESAVTNYYGINLRQGSSRNYIISNVISGNSSIGVYIDGTSGTNSNEVLGNYIGIGPDGSTDRGNDKGIYVASGARDNIIGDGTVTGRNVISGNTQYGIEFNGAHTNEAYGNYIGLDANGTSAVPNKKDGIYLSDAGYNKIGNGTAGGRNIISGNQQSGIKIFDSNSAYNEIVGNYIGTDVNGTTDLGNSVHGISIEGGAKYNTIGDGNVIAFNDQDGIRIDGSGTTHEVITQNSIFSNGGKGIELVNGGNGEVASPVINSANRSDITGLTLVSGTATAEPDGTVEIFKAEGDQGKTYLGSTTADGSGDWSLNVSGLVSGDAVVATGTTANPQTSAFSSSKEAITTVFKQYQPDNMIATLESYADITGEAIFNTTGANQTRTRSITTGNSVIYYVKIKNAGNLSDGYSVKGPASSGDWTLTYYDAKTGGSDISTQVTESGWTTNLASDEIKEIRMVVANSGSDVATLEALLTSTSTSDANFKDAVKASTTATPPPTDLSSFYINIPTSTIVNSGFSAIITALDSTGSTETVVIGTSSLAVNNGTITPESIADSSFTNGVWAGNISLGKIGSRTITITNGSSTGSAIIVVMNATQEFTAADLGIAGMSITIPAGAASAEVNITVSEVSSPGDARVGYSIGGTIVDINSTVTEFLTPVTVTIPINGPLADPRIYYWNGTEWSNDGITVVSVSDTSITFTTTHFTVFAPMGAIPSNLIRFGPNPYDPSSGSNAKIWYWLTADSQTSIYIVDMRGKLIWKESYASGSNGGQTGANNIDFNGKDRWGNTLGNGVYLYKVVQSGKSIGGGKIAIIK